MSSICVALLDKEDVIGMARTMTAGYCSHTPLTDVERSMLHFLVCCRMAQSVTMSSYSFFKSPENTYLLVTSKPGWTLLETLWPMSTADIDAFNSLTLS